MPEDHCPFCDVSALKNRIIWENKRVFVTLSNPRLTEGHTLVIPKVHVGSLSELSYSARSELLEIAVRYQTRLIQIFSAKWEMSAGCDLKVNTRPFMPQTQLSIPGHVHVHLRPCFWEDPYYQAVLRHEEGIFTVPSREELNEMQKLLKE